MEKPEPHITQLEKRDEPREAACEERGRKGMSQRQEKQILEISRDFDKNGI